MSRTYLSRFICLVIICIGISACSNKNRWDNGTGGGNGTYTPGSPQEFSQAVGDRVFFETDSTDLNATSISTLDKQSQWLQRNNRYNVLIEGHADERGTREYNYSLGSRRARIVRDYLVSRGIPSNRIRTVSYGKERPVAVCDNISCWSQNRRSVTVLENGRSF